MTPREFLESIARPNLVDLQNQIGDRRIGFNAIFAIDALPAHIFWWCKSNAPHECYGQTRDDQMRAFFAKRNSEYSLVRDIAKAEKHVELIDGNPEIQTTHQIASDQPPWGAVPWGEFPMGPGPFLVIPHPKYPGKFRGLLQVLQHALEFLEGEMLRIKIL